MGVEAERPLAVSAVDALRPLAKGLPAVPGWPGECDTDPKDEDLLKVAPETLLKLDCQTFSDDVASLEGKLASYVKWCEAFAVEVDASINENAIAMI